MTTLVVEELKTTLSQSFTVDASNRIEVKGIRPYIYMHNAPSGTFTIKIKSGADTLASKSFTSAEIKTDLSTSDNYAHIYKGLVFTDPLYLNKGAYEIELSSSGYTFTELNYLGWIRPHENIFNETDGLNTDTFKNPLGYQLFENKRA